MSKDRFEFLSSYVDDNVAGYYTKISEFAALAPAAICGKVAVKSSTQLFLIFKCVFLIFTGHLQLHDA